MDATNRTISEGRVVIKCYKDKFQTHAESTNSDGDLIRRSSVIDIINEEIERVTNSYDHNTQLKILFAVKELPIAYNVEKVVAELEKQAEQYNRRALELVDKSTEAGIHNKGKACSYEHAIDIVKRGGVDERT